MLQGARRELAECADRLRGLRRPHERQGSIPLEQVEVDVQVVWGRDGGSFSLFVGSVR